MNESPLPPSASKRPTVLTHHGKDRVDEWYWLREKENPEVIAYLEAENEFTKAKMADTEGLQEELFQQIKGRIQETDLSVPVRRKGWWYYSRSVEGLQYSISCRTRADHGQPTDTDPEVILLDQNVEARDSDFFSLGSFDVSTNGNLLAYGADHDGGEVYRLRIRDLTTGENLEEVIERTSGGTAWSADDDVLFYMRPDEMMRPYQVWRHVVGTNPDADELVFEEPDERFFVGVGNSKTEDYISIHIGSSLTSEQHLLRSNDPYGEFVVVEPRRHGIEYGVVHHRSATGERFFVMTNEDAPNFKLMTTGFDALSASNWTEVVAHRDDVKLDGVDPLADYLVLSERAEANERISLLDLHTGDRRVIEQDEDTYTAYPSGNAEFETSVLRFNYTSLVTPSTVFEMDLATGERTVLKQQPVLGDFKSSNYISERRWAKAQDGTMVPISMVYRKDRPERPGPTLLYGYGSYEISVDAQFSSVRLNLLDRGFVFAIAHIRGGGDMGRLWYEHGKFLEKKNTFTDFIACAEYLVAEGFTSPEQMVIRGGSAGGLLMGAVTNMRPDLFKAVVAEVPFVDSLTTMLDPTLPLTVHEYEEWGNPEEPEYYDYMASYSPYDNVSEQPYPNMLITGGLNDPRVSYWEPAKWALRLREKNTSDNEILLKTEMGAGHMGPSGRYDSWRDEAFVQAFVLKHIQ